MEFTLSPPPPTPQTKKLSFACLQVLTVSPAKRHFAEDLNVHNCFTQTQPQAMKSYYEIITNCM